MIQKTSDNCKFLCVYYFFETLFKQVFTYMKYSSIYIHGGHVVVFISDFLIASAIVDYNTKTFMQYIVFLHFYFPLGKQVLCYKPISQHVMVDIKYVYIPS